MEPTEAQKKAAAEAEARAEIEKKNNIEKLAKAVARLAEEEAKLGDIQRANRRGLKEELETQKATAKFLEKKLEQDRAEIALNELSRKELSEQIALQARKLAQTQEQLDLGFQVNHLVLREQAVYDALTKELREAESAHRGLEKALKKTEEATQEATDASAAMKTVLGSLTTSITGFRGGLGKTVTSLSKLKGVAHGIGTSLMSVFSPAGIIDLFASFGNVMLQAVLDVDNQRLALVQATGAAEGLQDAMSGLRAETMGLAVTGADLAQGLITLREGMRDFDSLTTKSKETMSVMATQLDKLGLAFQDQTRIMQFMNVTMGQTMGQAQKTVKELYNMTAAAGKGPKELAADFQAAAPMLSVYGKKMRHEFTMMASVSRETGIEMSKLMGIVGTMDTFEGAADLAGSMNAFLGGPYLNTVELVSMTEQERLIAIKRSMVASGRSFKQMSRYQQKGIAKSLNMDLAEANALFSSSERAIRGRSKAMAEAAKREMDYKKKIQESLPVMQALRSGFQEIAMAFMGALLGTGKDASPQEMVKALTEALQTFKKWVVESVVPAVKGMANGFGIVAHAIGVVSAGVTGFLAGISYIGKVLRPVTTVLKFFAKILSTIFNTLFGIWNIMKGVGNLLTGNFGKAMAQMAGGGLQVAAGVLTVGTGGAGAAIGAGMSLGGAVLANSVDDFIYRGDGSAKGATIQPINKNDSFVGVKSGGGMDHNMSAMLAELRSLNRAQAEQSRALRDLAEKTGKMQINMDGKKVGEAVSSTVIKKINRRGA